MYICRLGLGLKMGKFIFDWRSLSLIEALICVKFSQKSITWKFHDDWTWGSWDIGSKVQSQSQRENQPWCTCLSRTKIKNKTETDINTYHTRQWPGYKTITRSWLNKSKQSSTQLNLNLLNFTKFKFIWAIKARLSFFIGSSLSFITYPASPDPTHPLVDKLP